MRTAGLRDILTSGSGNKLTLEQMADVLGFRGDTAAFADWMEAEGLSAC
jgi:hypothetical protein